MVNEVDSIWYQVQIKEIIKGQVLADFITEFTPGASSQNDLLKVRILNVDGASNNKVSRIWIVLTTPEGSIIEQSYTLGSFTTNNKAKYEAVIAGLKMATTLRVTELEVRCDSLLVVSQVNREYSGKYDWMAAYLQIVLNLKSNFSCCDLK